MVGICNTVFIFRASRSEAPHLAGKYKLKREEATEEKSEQLQ